MRSVVVVILAASLAGCGSGSKSVPLPNYGSEDGLKIAQFVSQFNEDKADASRFKKAFAGKAPANWKAYEKVSYEVVIGSPAVNGPTATADVTIHKESNYEVIATKKWTFMKVGEQWKLQDAPLP